MIKKKFEDNNTYINIDNEEKKQKKLIKLKKKMKNKIKLAR